MKKELLVPVDGTGKDWPRRAAGAIKALLNDSATKAELEQAVSDLTDAINTGLAGKQGLDPTLTALAGLNGTAGLVEQTGADAFTKRAIGVGASTSVLTRGDGDSRYWQPGLVPLPSYTVSSLPASPGAGNWLAYCTDETGGAVPVFWDGVHWLRVTDRAIAS